MMTKKEDKQWADMLENFCRITQVEHYLDEWLKHKGISLEKEAKQRLLFISISYYLNVVPSIMEDEYNDFTKEANALFETAILTMLRLS